MGQTERTLKTRLNEHVFKIRQPCVRDTVLSKIINLTIDLIEVMKSMRY